MERGTRLFFFDRIVEEMEVGSVGIDNRLGACQSVEHLLGQGYRRIMHVAGPDHINIYRERKRGYLDAMTGAGIEVPPSWILEKPLVLEGGEAAFHEAISKGLDPDAFFCAGDFAALGVMQAAQVSGRKVPTDIGITGFANEPFTAFLNPSLTTVDQRGEEMGRNVAEMFMQCESGEAEADQCEKKVLVPRLIVRESSTP
jgi:LacI family transcriptional regulator